MTSLLSSGSRGGERLPQFGLQLGHPLRDGVDLGGETRVLGGQLVGGLEISAGGIQGGRTVHDGGQLGITPAQRRAAAWSAWMPGSASWACSSPYSAKKSCTECARGVPAAAEVVIGSPFAGAATPIRMEKVAGTANGARPTGFPIVAGAVDALATALAVTGLEARDPATGVQDLLLAGVERVAVRARPRH